MDLSPCPVPAGIIVAADGTALYGASFVVTGISTMLLLASGSSVLFNEAHSAWVGGPFIAGPRSVELALGADPVEGA